MNRSTTSRVSFVLGVPAVTLTLLVLAVARVATPSLDGGFVLASAIWLMLIALAEVTPLAQPRPASRLRLTAMFEFGALLCFTTVPAALIAGLGRLIAARLRSRRMSDALRDAAEPMLAIGIAGAVYFGQGERTGAVVSPGSMPFAPTVLAMGVFALATAGVTAWRRAAVRAPEDAPPAMPVEEQMLASAIALPIGAAFAWFEATSGPAAALCALALILMSRGIGGAQTPARVVPISPLSAPAASGTDSRLETVRLLMSAIDAFDPFTRGLSTRIARAAVTVARHLRLKRHEVEQIEYAALLHDIGRAAIHLDIHTRPGTLSGEERELLHTHPTVGYEMIRSIPGLETAAEIVLAHHEQPDGRGYPRGLRGGAVPIGSRIIMVAAAFDAMTRERPYRRGLQPSAAYEELRRHVGSQFFREVVETYIALHTAGAFESAPQQGARGPLPTPLEGADTELRAA